MIHYLAVLDLLVEVTSTNRKLNHEAVEELRQDEIATHCEPNH